jgi:flagellin-like hook-associated protein FlgL
MARLTVKTNIPSLNAQRKLDDATKRLQESFNRLSSGLRINKASDDAAGLSVSSGLETNARVFNQGVRNINDGVSYLNVADGALEELSNIVTRMSELAEQGANGTLGNSQRDALQSEVTALESEYNRIINSVKFNGKQLLSGTTTNTVLQGGYGENGQLAVQLGDASLGIANDLSRAGLTTVESTDSSGSSAGSGVSQAEGISADGRFILFRSDGTGLVSGDTNGTTDMFLKDTATGETTHVTTDSSGVQSNGPSIFGKISADGRYVTFASGATNLVAGDTNGVIDVFRKDTVTGETIRISADSAEIEGNASSGQSAISADGRYVAFVSDSTNLVAGDTNGVTDIFRKDTVTGETIRISTDSSGLEGNVGSFAVAISADGRYVTFSSDSTNLVAGDTNGVADIFRKDTATGETIRISTDSAGVESNATSSAPAISADGRYVSYSSGATNLVAGDTNGVNDVFRKDTVSGETIRISTDSFGVESNAISNSPAMSADGRYVAFLTGATNLVDITTSGDVAAYIKDTVTDETVIISTNSSGVQDTNADVEQLSISADGRFAAYNDADTTFARDLSQAGIQEISGLVVSNQAASRVTLALLDNYRVELSNYRAGIGASLSRADTFLNNLKTSSLNYEAAAAQITDADIAEESAKLAANNIVRQAAVSVLAQANQQPELALLLLQRA